MGVRKTIAAVLVPVLVAAGAVVAVGGPEGGAGSRPDWLDELEAAPAGADSVPWQGSSSARPPARGVPGRPATFEFPAPARWGVTLAPGSAPAADGRPVRLAARGAGAAGGSARIEVLDRAVARRVDASGFAFTVSTPGQRLPVTMSVDYSRFAKAYGAGYADRLRLVGLPACALADPVPHGCQPARTVLAARNDRAAGTLTAAVDVAGVAAFAVASAPSGEDGSFSATPLSISGSWQVSPGSGEFGYSYPMAVPTPAGGSPPSVALGYSSGAIDGLTIGNNTQAGPTGLGWSDFAGAFIERRYEPCIHADAPTTDLCWKSDNATISLNGLAGPLIPANAANTQWRVMSDPGWRIERLTGAPHTGIYQQQYWKVIGPDGTQYWFGSGQMPGQQTYATLGVPVWADNVGEPCRASPTQAGACLQGWRWYLDRVVDPDGNMTAYVYERQENWFAGLLGIGGNVGDGRYQRAAMLKHIYYGGQGWDANQFAGHVEFGLEWRCVYLVANCPEPVKNSTGFPDVPTDLICAQNQACTVYAPSFFNARRYAFVRTQVRVGSAWRNVAQYNLYHRFFENTSGVAEKLQLDSVVYAAIAFGKLNAYPPTTFSYTWKNNRVDHDGVVARAMRHNRLTKVTNPFGGTTTVTYGLKSECPQNYPVIRYPHWDLNVLDCFPQSVKDGIFTGTGVFHKYLVTKVVESAGLGAPDMVTTYTYGGSPAWAYDTGAFARDEDELGWSVWRGYDTVTITQGTSKTRLRLFRGWDNDWMLEQATGGDLVPVYGRRHPPAGTIDGSLTYVDDVALAGRILEEQSLGTLGGVADSVLQSRRHEYTTRDTATPAGFLIRAEWAGLATTTERVYSAPGAFRERRSRTTYTAGTQPQPTTTLEEGWLDVTGDERCSITTYADNPTAGLVVYPAVNKKVAGACTSTDVLTLTETYYDGTTTLGAAPTRGNPTRQRALIENGRWSESTTEFDVFGRPVRVTDPTGAVSTTAYAVTAGAWVGQVPIRRTDTNALGHRTIAEIVPEFGVTSKQTDANGSFTDFSYDEFGRLVAVWLPDAPLDFAEPSWRFAYNIPNRTIHTRRLTSDERCCEDAVFSDTWAVHDGFWRSRQTQGLSPASGRTLVTETTYDDQGRPRDETVEQALTGPPGRYIAGGTWLNRTRHLYDELGREVRTEWLRGTTPLHATTTAYGLDTVTVTGPDGRQVRERTDGLGRSIAAEEFDGQAWVSSRYTYDLADRLLTVTDPAGNRFAYTVNRAGWRIAQQDPDRGNASFTYDNAGRQLSATDASGRSVHTAYDALGRPVERRSGSATGTPLASWQYDTAPRGLGRAHRETTHTTSGNWVSEVTGYDIKGRVEGSRLSVPAGIAGLSGSYTVTQTYDRADRVRTVDYPAIGGLPAERLTTTRNTFGLPTGLAGIDPYVWNVVYDDRGRRTSAGLGPRPGGSTWMGRTWTYDLDQRVSAAETFVAGAGIVSRHDLAFDAAGNLKQNLTRQGGQSWMECFGYDQRRRLTSAYTVAATATCAGGAPGTGDRPYTHQYTYSADGRLTARTENGTATAYTYPAPGAPRAHAPTRVGADTYSWDATGSLASRTVGGRTETFTWDAQHRLASVAGPSGTTSFVYDAAGQRLLRRAPDGRATLYFAGHEVTANTGGSIVSAVRPYTFDGQLIATRTAAGVEYLVSDAAGSVEVAAPSGGAATSATRAYEPYGQVRAQTGDPATERGFLGQVEDSSTSLSYLNARYYDATAGVFISADPVYDPSKPKTINPYAYSVNNPTTYSDPGGAYSTHTFALERANAALQDQVRKLIGHIRQLNAAIAELQEYIREQQSYIKDLLTYIDALEAEIARQQSIIRQLEAHIVALQRQVSALRAENSRLRAHIAHQDRVIRYYQGVVNVLGFRLWGGTPHFERVMNSIHSFQGIPADAFAVDNISRLQAENARLRSDIRIVTDGGIVNEGTWDSIHENRDVGFSDAEIAAEMVKAQFGAIQANWGTDEMNGREQYDAGYEDGYEAGKNHYDWGDFFEDGGCYVGGQIPGVGIVIDSACLVAPFVGD